MPSPEPPIHLSAAEAQAWSAGWEARDDEVYSNSSIGDRRLTWRELHAEAEERYRRASAMAQIVYDLDRCQHGRHRGDICSGTSGCNGPSKGNPVHAPGSIIGFDIGGRPYTMPEGHLKTGNPDNWST